MATDCLESPMKDPIIWSLCLLCQKKGTEELRKASDSGIERVLHSAGTRKCLISEQLLKTRSELMNKEVVWHKSCYSSFTSQHNIDRINRKRIAGKNIQESREDSNKYDTPTSSNVKRTRLSFDVEENWQKCIICNTGNQRSGKKGILAQVLTFEGCETLKNAALLKADEKMLSKISGVDLIAKECKYHRMCWKKYTYVDKAECSSANENETQRKAFCKLCSELEQRLLQRHEILRLSSINERYCKLLVQNGIDQTSKPDRLKEKLINAFGDGISFYRPANRSESLLVYSTDCSGQLLENLVKKISLESEEEFINHDMSETQDEFSVLYKAALILRKELQKTTGIENWPPDEQDITREVVEKMIGENLKRFITWLTISQREFDNLNTTSKNDKRVLSICQDILFVSSNGVKLTPKHVGIAIAIHHRERDSKNLQMLNRFGHSISRDQVSRILTAVANKQEQQYSNEDDVIIPSCIKQGLFTQIAADNNDLLEETIDGKSTTHCTNMIVIQHPNATITSDIISGGDFNSEKIAIVSKRDKTLKDVRKCNIKSYIKPSKPAQVGDSCKIDTEYLSSIQLIPESASLMESCWIQTRLIPIKLATLETDSDEHQQAVPGWTAFNELSTVRVPCKSIIGYCPVIDAAPSDSAIVYTVMNVACKITKSVGQTHTVLVFDQAIYCKAIAISLDRVEEFKNLIIRLGGFHTILAFLAVLGKRQECSGFEDILVESGCIAEGSVPAVMSGKAYNRAVRAHKLVFEALHRQLDAEINTNAQTNDGLSMTAESVYKKFKDGELESIPEEVNEMRNEITTLEMKRSDYISKSNSPTAEYWFEYLCMVNTMLQFIRAERIGNWTLHLSSFAAMLPYFFAFDRTNYARFGTIYLTQMLNLPTTAPHVYEQFMDGNFVVSRSMNKFAQVSVDLALEQTLNKDSKTHGGIIGVSLKDETVHRWIQTAHFRARLSSNVEEMTDVKDITTHHKELGKTRITKDETDVQQIQIQLNDCFSPFQNDPNLPLVNIKSGEVAGEEIFSDLKRARQMGNEALKVFVEERLKTSNGLYDPLKKMNLKTFAHKRKKSKTSPVKTISDDRELFARLVIVAQVRQYDLEHLFSYELANIPLSIATTDGGIRKTQKSALMAILEENVKDKITDNIDTDISTCVIFDLMAEIQKSKYIANETSTFEAYANKLFSVLIAKSGHSGRIDIVADRYDKEESIKTYERSRRTNEKSKMIIKIRRPTLPLPNQWEKFIAVSENKTELANFLLEFIKTHSVMLNDKCLYVAGCDQLDGSICVRIHNGEIEDIHMLYCSHEEADTRILLHSKDAFDQGFKHVIIHSPDTDVLVLCVSKAAAVGGKMTFVTGIGNKKRCLPVLDIQQSIGDSLANNLLSMHAVTGCDSVSSFYGIGKPKAFGVYKKNTALLDNFGDTLNISDNTLKKAEQFIVNCYMKNSECTDINKCRYMLFLKSQKQNIALPPCKNTLTLHLKRANYQAYIWKYCLLANPPMETPKSHGWDDDMLPILTDGQPAPKQLLQFHTCGCKTKCSRNCSCQRNQLRCVPSCGCGPDTCQSEIDLDEDE